MLSRPQNSKITSNTQRKINLVGSIPEAVAPDAATAMRWMLDQVPADRLTTLPCDDDPQWIVKYLSRLASEVPALVQRRNGAFADYDDFPVNRVRRGHRLDTDDVALRRGPAVQAALAGRAELNEPHLPPHQVSIPSPLDLATFTFGSPQAALPHLALFTRSVAREVREIRNEHTGQDLVFQVESPLVLGAFDACPRPSWPVLARLLARQVADLFARALPRDSRAILHLCYGDYGHKALIVPEDLEPVVLFVNALSRRMATLRQPMPTVHVPAVAGDQAPPTRRAFYRPLSGIVGCVPLVAGVVDEQHPEDSRRALELFDEALGHPAAAIGASCGLGRRTPAAAAQNCALALQMDSDNQHAAEQVAA